jgi:thioredoxin-dependent peroxiredoxin
VTRPEPGDPVPSFTMADDAGGQVSSGELLGKRYVLYFYPKDDTPGCTTQACSLRDNWSRIVEAGLEIFGVSPDSVKSHARFRSKYRLPYRLLSDQGHVVAEAFGVWVEKSFAGRTYKGTERTTFVIGLDGRIESVLPRVKPDQHVDLVLGALSSAARA